MILDVEPPKRKMTATEFKAKCLEILDQVNQTGEVIEITKRGNVVAELRAPYSEKPKPAGPGFAKGQVWTTGDIMEPLDFGIEEMVQNWDEQGFFSPPEDVSGEQA